MTSQKKGKQNVSLKFLVSLIYDTESANSAPALNLTTFLAAI